MHFCFSIRQVGSTFNWSGVQILCFSVLIFPSLFLFPGTPINRLPIMAKQVLDLYELYNLVTSRGGLVEVINKKQWQEIIKGLNLPSSITSAAFTLRTQWVHAIIAKWIFLLKSIFFSVKTQQYLIPNIGYGTNLNSLWIHEKLFLPSTSMAWFSSPQLYRR